MIQEIARDIRAKSRDLRRAAFVSILLIRMTH